MKIVTPILKNCLVNHDSFKWHILCLELKTVEKIPFPLKRIFKVARDKSYLQLVYLEENIEGRRLETLYSFRCGCKFGESKTDKAFTQHKHDKYSFQTKTQKPVDKYFLKARETPGEFVALVIVLRTHMRFIAIHGLPITLPMLKVKSDKSDWFWSQSIVFTQPFKTGMSLGLARGPDISSA